LFDKQEFVELDKTTSKILCTLWTQKITDRLKDVMEKIKLKDAGCRKSKGKELVICCMDFAFIGGSMETVVGEKIARGMITQLKQNAFVMISKSGGARMMEAAYSLCNAKNICKIAQH
jgi:acetyl-CoA carboxylase carboxyl transferase subunit beta